MLISMVAGLFSLLGALLGAFMARRGDHRKWLRERRSLAAEKCLSTLAECSKVHMQHVAQDRTGQAIFVAIAFLPAEDYARIVRLYLPKRDREPFSSLVSEIITLHISLGADTKYHATINTKMDLLQSMLESSLEPS